jgi:hypothetical protein
VASYFGAVDPPPRSAHRRASFHRRTVRSTAQHHSTMKLTSCRRRRECKPDARMIGPGRDDYGLWLRRRQQSTAQLSQHFAVCTFLSSFREPSETFFRAGAAAGAELDDVVGTRDHPRVVLDDDEVSPRATSPRAHEPVEHGHEAGDAAQVQAGGGLVEHVEGRLVADAGSDWTIDSRQKVSRVWTTQPVAHDQ